MESGRNKRGTRSCLEEGGKDYAREYRVTLMESMKKVGIMRERKHLEKERYI